MGLKKKYNQDRVTLYTHFEEIYLPGAVVRLGNAMSAHLGHYVSVVARTMRKNHGEPYRLVDVCEELARRELNDIIESRGLRDD